MNENQKKRILYFIPEFSRLTETFILREVGQLIKNDKLDITVLSIQKGSAPLGIEVEKRTFYERLNLLILLQAFVIYLVRNFRGMFEAFSLVTSIDERPVFERLKLFIKGVGYAKIFEKYNPDQIHAHFFSWPSTIALVVSKVLDVPLSISAHARDIFVEGSLIKVKSQNSRFVAVCNEAAAKKCREIEGDTGNIYKIYHGVDLKDEFLLPSTIEKPKRPVIFVGSRLVEKKGLNTVIEASKILKDKGIDHEIHIVGPGPLYEKLVEYCKKLNVTDTVFIPGEGKGLPFTQNVQYFKIADIFAHPSIKGKDGDIDGVPTYIIEAALAKLPIITTNVGSISDLIDETTGVIIPENDPETLAKEIERLLNNPELRHSLGLRAHEKAEGLFNLEKNTLTLENLFLK